MTKRATRSKPQRRGSASPRRKQQSRRTTRPGMLDQAIAALPMSEATLHKVATWSILGVVGAVALGVATWFGIPGAMGVALAEGIGRAGFRVNQIEVTGLHRMDRMQVYAVVADQKSRAMPLVDINEVRNRLLAFGWVAFQFFDQVGSHLAADDGQDLAHQLAGGFRGKTPADIGDGVWRGPPLPRRGRV